MKRLMGILLLVAMLALIPAAIAEDSPAEPILFRGIAWGTPYGEIFDESGYTSSRDWAWEPKGLDALFFEGGGTYYGEVGFGVESHLPQGEKVAGYSVDEIRFFFIYTPDEDGSLSDDKASAVLCFAEYDLDFGKDKVSYDAAFEDLTNKLTRLYGDIDSEPTSAAYGTKAVWRGGEGTLVSLYSRRITYLNSSDPGYELQIHYATEAMDTWLQQAKEALDREFSTLTDGL